MIKGIISSGEILNENYEQVKYLGNIRNKPGDTYNYKVKLSISASPILIRSIHYTALKMFTVILKLEKRKMQVIVVDCKIHRNYYG